MIYNKKMVKKNKLIKKIQKEDKKENKDKKIDNDTVLKRNINKLVYVKGGYHVPMDNGLLPTNLSVDAFLELIKNSNLKGQSGNGFPVEEKLRLFLQQPRKKAIIINGAECEPGLIHDTFLMKNKNKEIVEGVELLNQLLKPEKMFIATRGKKEYFTNLNNGIEYVRIPYLYPFGEEHFLIQQVLKEKIDIKAHPIDNGILVMNVQTIYQITRILKGIYDNGHFVTLANMLTGEAYASYIYPTNRIKDTILELFPDTLGCFYVGHGNNSATKLNDSDCFEYDHFFAAIGPESTISNDHKCLHCGGCEHKCPMGIQITKIVKAKENDINADISSFDIDKCIHCGTCTYFCGAGKNPLEYIMNK